MTGSVGRTDAPMPPLDRLRRCRLQGSQDPAGKHPDWSAGPQEALWLAWAHCAIAQGADPIGQEFASLQLSIRRKRWTGLGGRIDPLTETDQRKLQPFVIAWIGRAEKRNLDPRILLPWMDVSAMVIEQ